MRRDIEKCVTYLKESPCKLKHMEGKLTMLSTFLIIFALHSSPLILVSLR